MQLRTPLRVCGVLALVATALPSQDWPHWRGPNYDGSAAVNDLPASFGKDENVRWATELPGPGAGTPIVVGDRIFLSSVDAARDRLVAMCLSRKSGEVLWKKDAGSGYVPEGGRGSRTTRGGRSNYASPSPTTDGEHVVFFFGNGDLVGYTVAGEELWRRNIQKDYGKFAFQWTFSASPTLWQGMVFLPVMQRDTPTGGRRGGFGRRRGGGRRGGGQRGDQRGAQPQNAAASKPIESFLLGIDPKTGENAFKVARPSPARLESREAYTTPIPYVGAGGRKELLVLGGDVLTAHDPKTGKELWRWGTWNQGHRQRAWRLVPTVAIGDDMAAICAPKRAPVFGVKLGGDGELGADSLVWQSEGRPNPVSSDVPTPAFHDGHFYVLSDVNPAISKVDAKTGEVAWTTPLSRDFKWRASPTFADGKVYCMNHNGHVVVADAASGKIVHECDMGGEDDDQIRASIVAAHGSLFIRTNTALYCIGKR